MDRLLALEEISSFNCRPGQTLSWIWTRQWGEEEGKRERQTSCTIGSCNSKTFQIVKPQRGLLKWKRAACMRFAFEMRLLEFNKNVLLSHKKYLNIFFLSFSMQWTCPEGNLHKWMRIGIVQFGKKPLPTRRGRRRRRMTKPGSAPSAVLAPCGCILWLVCLVCCLCLPLLAAFSLS